MACFIIFAAKWHHQWGTLSTESIPFQWRFCDLAGRSEVGVLFFIFQSDDSPRGSFFLTYSFSLWINDFSLFLMNQWITKSNRRITWIWKLCVWSLNQLNLKLMCFIKAQLMFVRTFGHDIFKEKKVGLFFSESWRALQKRCWFLPWDGHRIKDW